VKKTSLYLDPDVDLALERLAAAEGVTKAEIVRRALSREAQRSPRPRLTAIGVGAGPGDVADNIDEHLRDTDFGSR
jgi:predicted transcriptional regulator